MTPQIWLVTVAITIWHWTTPPEVLVDRQLSNGHRAKVLQETIVEHRPTQVEQLDDGWILHSGGDVETNVAVLLLIDESAVPTHLVAWHKMHTFAVGPDLGPAANHLTQARRELRRLRVYDVAWHEDRMLIAYSADGRMQLDIVTMGENDRWHVETTLKLFEQRHSHASPEGVRAARVVVHEGECFIHFEMVQPVEQANVWVITPNSATKVDETELIEAVLDAAAERQLE